MRSSVGNAARVCLQFSETAAVWSRRCDGPPVCANGRRRTRRRAINSGFLLGPVRHGSKATWTFSHARLFRKTTDSDKETTEDSNDCNPLWYAWIPILQVCNKRSSAQVPCPQGSVTSFWSSALKRATGPHAACNAGASTK